jgi:hypothetical protein
LSLFFGSCGFISSLSQLATEHLLILSWDNPSDGCNPGYATVSDTGDIYGIYGLLKI